MFSRLQSPLLHPQLDYIEARDKMIEAMVQTPE